MSRLLSFNTAVVLVVVMGGLAFVNKATDNGQPQWSSAFAGLLLIFLVLASIVPVVMVPVGMVVVLWQLLHSMGLGEWITQVGKGPAAGITGLGNDQGQLSPTQIPGGNF